MAYLVNLGISHELLDYSNRIGKRIRLEVTTRWDRWDREGVGFITWILRVEAVASEDLDGISGSLVGNLTGQSLGDRGQVSVALAAVNLPSGLQVAESGRLDADSHISQHESNCLMLIIMMVVMVR